jgi:hypothetical protein
MQIARIRFISASFGIANEHEDAALVTGAL